MLEQAASRECGLGSLVLRPAPAIGRSALWAVAELLDVAPPIAAGLSAESHELYPVFRRLHHRLVHLAGAQPVCLLIDDLAAPDAATVAWLDFALRRTEHLRLFIMVALRSDPSGTLDGPRSSLALNPNCTVLDLTPLPLHATAELVAATLDAEPERELIEVCQQLSAGNPRHLGSVLTRLRLRAVESGVTLLEAVDAALVATAVVGRFGSLPNHAKTVAAAIAVLGRIEPDLIGPIAGLAPDAVADAIHVLDREYLLRQGHHVRLRDWTYAAIISTLGQPELTRLRIRAAVILQDNGRPIDEVAQQLVELEHTDRPWMTRVLVDAAAAASVRTAESRAAEYLRRALEAEPDDLATRVSLAISQARIDPATGLSRLAGLYERTTTGTVFRARAALALALTSRFCGRPGQARELLLLAARELDAAPPRPGAQDVRTLIDAGLLLINLGDPSTAATAVEHAARIDWPSGRTMPERCLLAVLAQATMRAGGPLERAEHHARLALSDDSRTDDWMTSAAASVLRCAGRFEEAMWVLTRAIDGATENSDELGRCRLLASRARVSIAIGALDDAERDTREAFAIAERRSWLSHEPGIAITFALAKAKLGEHEEAQRLLEAVGHARIAGRTDEHYEFHYAMAWTAIARRDWQTAADELFACGRVMAESSVLNPVLLPWWADAAVAAVLLDQRELAVFAMESGIALSKQWNTPESKALVTLIRGLTAPGPRGLALLLATVEQFAALPTRTWHAFAEFLVGKTHFTAGDDQAARPHLRTAISLALTCGGGIWVSEAHRMLQQAGGRMRMRPVAEHDLLTASERRVVKLAVDGATNRKIADTLFVSLRTVELHLTRAYRKLGISGRRELRAATQAGGQPG